MSLFYPKLKEEATIEVWKSNLERVAELWGDKLRITKDNSKAILQYARSHFKELDEGHAPWNGRQIRNAFQTAVALAEYEAYEFQADSPGEGTVPALLKKKHFEQVAKASKHFDQYLAETVGTTADLAMEAHERMDELDETEITPQLEKKSPKSNRNGSSKR